MTIDPDAFRLVVKGKCKGVEIAWRDLVSGEAAMAVALGASLRQPGEGVTAPTKKGGSGHHHHAWYECLTALIVARRARESD